MMTTEEQDEESEAGDKTSLGPIEAEVLAGRVKELELLVSQHLDGWQRAQAEFQNYRRRVERDNQLTYDAMKGNIIRSVLPVLDDLERALLDRPAGVDPWVGGIELIQRKLQSILEAEGLRRIEAEGVPFDPELHEAISHEQADGVEAGNVIGVTRNGYRLGDRVIRPALVRGK
jgi:molecular chaperone GrpE